MLADIIPPKQYEEKLRIGREHSPAANGWTLEEVETLRLKLRQGYTLAQIADVLPNRTLAAVETKYRRMRMKGEI